MSFREMLWLSDLRLAVLPARYNTRRYTWADTWFSDRPPPVILHLNRYHPLKHGRFRRMLDRLAAPD
jgi:hypothetical protein